MLRTNFTKLVIMLTMVLTQAGQTIIWNMPIIPGWLFGTSVASGSYSGSICSKFAKNRLIKRTTMEATRVSRRSCQYILARKRKMTRIFKQYHGRIYWSNWEGQSSGRLCPLRSRKRQLLRTYPLKIFTRRPGSCPALCEGRPLLSAIKCWSRLM